MIILLRISLCIVGVFFFSYSVIARLLYELKNALIYTWYEIFIQWDEFKDAWNDAPRVAQEIREEAEAKKEKKRAETRNHDTG